MRRTASILAAAAICALSGVSAAGTTAPTTGAPTTLAPSSAPTSAPTTTAPTVSTTAPTGAPSSATEAPTTLTTEAPTTRSPTTLAPTKNPTTQPTDITGAPTAVGDTGSPTVKTTSPTTTSPTTQTKAPTATTVNPTTNPTKLPTTQPTKRPTNSPSISNGALQASVCECRGNRKSSGLTRPFCDECMPGWVGTDCDRRVTPCSPARCSNHGSCDLLERCVCNIGFSGEFCESCAAGFQGSSCQYNATSKAQAACDADSCMLNGTKNCLSGVPAALLAVGACGSSACSNGLCCSWKSVGHWQGATWIYPGQQHGTTCRASDIEKCCGPGPVTPFGQDCVDEVYGKSCQAGFSACMKKHDNGTSAATSAADISCCSPSQTCCDGGCCDYPSKACASYDRDSYPASVLNNPNNGIPYYKCVKKEDSGTISLYNIMIGALPMPAMAYFLFAFLAAMKLSLSVGCSWFMRINAFVIMCVCVGSVFAGGLWTMGVMVSCSLLVSMLLLQAKTRKWVWRSLGIQLLTLWVTMVAPMSTIVQDYYTTGVTQAWRVPLQQAAPSVTADALLSSMQSCSTYYAYFHLDVALRSCGADFYPGANANADGFDLYFGVCGYLFMTVIGMALMALPVLLFVFMIQTLFMLMEAPEDEAKPNNKAAHAGSASSSGGDGGGGMEMQTMSAPTTNVPADYAGATTSGPPAVDHGWQELHTDEGVPYYFNSHSNVTTWEKPAELGGYPAEAADPEFTASPLHT